MTPFHHIASRFSSWRIRGTGCNPRRPRLAIEPLEHRELLDATILPETSVAAPAIITFQDQVTNTYMPYIA